MKREQAEEQARVLARATPDDPLMGDQAYRAVDNVVTPRRKPRGKERPPEDVAFNRAFARARIIAEHSIRDLRQFQALTLPDRHRRRGQEPRVCAVVELRARPDAVPVAVIGIWPRKPPATGRGEHILPPILKMNY